MYPPKLGYVRADNLNEALEFLESHEDARPLAGGHSLIPMLKLRLIRPSYLVDIRRIQDLQGIKVEGGSVRIGALATHAEVASSQIIKESVPLLSEVASVIADPQVRNMGTIGGSVSHCDPSADYPASLIALEAKVRLVSRRGEREVPFSNFQKDIFTADIQQGELVKEVVVPVTKGYKYSYQKLERRAGDYAIVGVAVLLKMDGSSVSDVRIGLTSVGPKALRASSAEEVLRGKSPTSELLEKAADEAMKVASPTSDIRGSAEYKTKMVKVMTKRALTKALSR